MYGQTIQKTQWWKHNFIQMSLTVLNYLTIRDQLLTKANKLPLHHSRVITNTLGISSYLPEQD